MAAFRDWSDETGSLRRFGLALTRDERFVLDDATANRLVDKLMRQTSVAAIGEERVSYTGRVRAFARFIQLHRRYVRRMALEDMDGNWVETPPATGRGGPAAANGIRALPLELREALLHHIPDTLYHDDLHGKPAWRKHMTLRLAEEIRAELQGLARP